MSATLILSDDEKDCLQELMNISYGAATAAISKIIDRFATLSIPAITVISSEDLRQKLLSKLHDNKTFFISNQLVNGNLSGQNLFIIDSDSSKNLATEFGLEEEEQDREDIEDLVLEITNILSSTASSKLAELLNTKIGFSSPTIKYINSNQNIDLEDNSDYENIIVISTNLQFENQNINAELVFMKHNNSFSYLKEHLNEFLDDY